MNQNVMNIGKQLLGASGKMARDVGSAARSLKFYSPVAIGAGVGAGAGAAWGAYNTGGFDVRSTIQGATIGAAGGGLFAVGRAAYTSPGWGNFKLGANKAVTDIRAAVNARIGSPSKNVAAAEARIARNNMNRSASADSFLQERGMPSFVNEGEQAAPSFKDFSGVPTTSRMRANPRADISGRRIPPSPASPRTPIRGGGSINLL